MELKDIRLITFDCYGTLIDWNRGIRGAFERVASQAGINIDPEDLQTVYEEEEAKIEAQPYRPYAQVQAEAAMAVAKRLNIPAGKALGRVLPQTLPSWPPFDDTVASLKRLATRYRLGILSNIDRNLLAGSLRQLGVTFDLLITAEDVRSYKPAPGHFDALVARAGCPKGAILHAAQSRFHDIAPAREHGLASVWINRRREDSSTGPRPDLEFPDLKSFCDHLKLASPS